MANASMKWTNHVSSILQGLQGEGGSMQEQEGEDEDEEEAEEPVDDLKLPEIHPKSR